MPEKVSISQAELERMIEERLRTSFDQRAAQTENDPDRRGTSQAWRGSLAPEAAVRKPVLTKENAKDVMSFFRGVLNQDHAEIKRAQTALGMERIQQVGINQDGGLTVPYQFLDQVTVVLPRVTPFADANLIRIIPMQSETTRWTKVVTKPATPPIVAEGGQYTKTGVTFGLIELVARKIGEIIPLTEEIMFSNQVAMVELIAELIGEQLGYKRNALVTNGSGAGEPEGVMTNGLVSSVAWTATNDQTKADSVINIFHGLATRYRPEAIWLMNDATIALVRKLKDTQGRYLWTDAFGALPATILGRPVYENSDLTAAQILFGNFRRGYVLGEREGLEVEKNSSGTDWEKDIVNFKFRQRYDGKVNDDRAFVKCTTVS
jgi:HK97 family phage major capsid protein